MDAVRQTMIDRLATLQARGARLEAHLRAPTEPDAEERALAAEGDEVVERLSDAARSEIAAIQAALHRMELGTWGSCEVCGGPIGDARLRAIPTANRCVDCA